MTAKRAAESAANERPAKKKLPHHFVLYANGFPAHSSDDRDELATHKVIATIAAQKAGLPNPKFHVVQRDVNFADKSVDTILEGDEENPPKGCNLESA